MMGSETGNVNPTGRGSRQHSNQNNQNTASSVHTRILVAAAMEDASLMREITKGWEDLTSKRETWIMRLSMLAWRPTRLDESGTEARLCRTMRVPGIPWNPTTCSDCSVDSVISALSGFSELGAGFSVDRNGRY